MDIKDLMIGNIITKEGSLCIVTPLVILDIVSSPELFEPMALTQEVLADDLGFKLINSTSSVVYRDGVHLMFRDNNWFYDAWETDIKFTYVHELQNFMKITLNVVL